MFPTATLGKEYYSVNFTNISNTSNSNCWFYVIAVDTGTTTVEITPSAATINHAAGIPFTVNLTQGQVFNIMGQMSGNVGVDLTGSKIRTITTGNNSCKRVAVFSGSGRISKCRNGDSYIGGLVSSKIKDHLLGSSASTDHLLVVSITHPKIFSFIREILGNAEFAH